MPMMDIGFISPPSKHSNMTHPTQQQALKRQVLAFFANLGIFSAAILHIYVASVLDAYENPLSPTNPQVNFKEFITPNAKLMAYCGLLLSITALSSIFSLLFLTAHARPCTCITNVVISLFQLGCCWVVPIQTLLSISSWNQINNATQSVSSFVQLFTSVFVGNIDRIQYYINVQIYTALLFFAFSGYNLYFWSSLLAERKREGTKRQAKA